MKHIDLYVDPTSAASYLAFEPTLVLLARTGTQASWHMARKPRRHTASADGEETVSERHKRVRQAYQDDEAARYARWRGLPMQTPRAELDAAAVAAALASVESQPQIATDYLRSLYDHYWSGNPAPLHAAGVQQLLTAAGGPVISESALAQGPALLHEAGETGVFDVPAYRIAGEVFIGRQHLPLIERIIREGLEAVIPPLPPKASG